MKHILHSFLVVGLLAATLVLAGEKVIVCKDQHGYAYYTDVGCPVETNKLGRFYAPNDQHHIAGGGLTEFEEVLTRQIEESSQPHVAAR